jgi:hypothetical protein
MRGHDYASAASYFVTLCAERRACLFGTVIDGVLVPSPAGVVVDSWWHYLPARFASVELDASVVMPNHFHAIIHLGTDPNREAAPNLGNIARWFKIRTTYDSTIGVKTEGWPPVPGTVVAAAISRPHHPRRAGSGARQSVHRGQSRQVGGRRVSPTVIAAGATTRISKSGFTVDAR